MIRKRIAVLVLSMCMAFISVFGMSACECGGNQNALDVPRVTIDADGNVSWTYVAHATGYKYKISDGEEVYTTDRKCGPLSHGQYISVKAVAGEGYSDGKYCAPIAYYAPGSLADCVHADADGDEVCDKCYASVIVPLAFYAINDLHGKFIDTDSQPGLDEFSSYMKNLYADPARHEILLSSGDMWQGSVESSGNRGSLMTEWMNRMDFVSMTLGNHEYDWGAEIITRNLEQADFSFLAINVLYKGEPVSYCSPSVTVEKGGVKIGIIGAIGNCLSSISGEYTDGLYFATGDDLTRLVMAESEKLRSEGCDFIVYSIHGGYDSSASGKLTLSQQDMQHYDEKLSDGYVDLVFEGHTHQHYIGVDRYGVYHLQGGGENNYVSNAKVDINVVTGAYKVTPRLIGNSEYADWDIEPDPCVEEIYGSFFPDGDPYKTVVGYNANYRSSDEICNTVALLYYMLGTERWGEEYDVVLGGGYLNTRSPYSLPPGNVTYAQLYSLLPFDNTIVLGKILGADLKAKFLQNYRYSEYCPSGEREFEDSKYYYIVVDTYTSTYKSNRITEVARYDSGVYARDILADYIANGGYNGNGIGIHNAYSAYRQGGVLYANV